MRFRVAVVALVGSRLLSSHSSRAFAIARASAIS